MARIAELDGLRGLAAASVVLHHALWAAPGIGGRATPLARALTAFPLRALWDGHAAVMLFFVLSGFVLAGAWRPPWRAYALGRAWRIYPVALAALAGGALLRAATPPATGMTPWFAANWTGPAAPPDFALEAALVLRVPGPAFDWSLWSLAHELRISLAFPLILLAVARAPRLTAAAALILTGVACLAGESGWGWALTGHYAGAFALGAATARHREKLVAWYAGLGPAGRAAFAAAAATLYGCAYVPWGKLVPGVGPGHPAIPGPLADVPIALGAAGLIVAAVGGGVIGRGLRSALPQYLGRVSYSLYAWHVPVLLATVRAGPGRWPPGCLLAASAGLSLAVAELSYRWIERPSIAAGRRARVRGPAPPGGAGPPAAAPPG
jgi:peptidoglycan/LPS O-acetylase OafA/YrhL